MCSGCLSGVFGMFPQENLIPGYCLSYFFIVLIRHHDQSSLGKVSICFILQVVVCHTGKSRNQCRGYRGVMLTGLFRMACSACFLIPSRDHVPRDVLPTVNWALPNQSSVKKICHRPIWWAHSQLRFPLPKPVACWQTHPAQLFSFVLSLNAPFSEIDGFFDLAVRALSHFRTLIFSAGFWLLREAGWLSCLCQTVKVCGSFVNSLLLLSGNGLDMK